jgi:hypothetical protein
MSPSNVITPETYRNRTGLGGGLKQDIRTDVAEHKYRKNSKDRLNWSTGGWCGKRKYCENANTECCDSCFKFRLFEEKE